MQQTAWDKLSEIIETARISPFAQACFTWSIQGDYFYLVTVEWNGGLPIISYRNLQNGTENFDITALQMRDLLEACE